MIVEELFESLGLKLNEAQWSRGERAVEGIKKGLEGIKESSFAETIKKGLEVFAGYEAVKHVAEFVSQTIEAAVSAKHLGERIGITAEAVQELGYAADVTGSSAEGMTIGMQHLARGLQELRTKGTGPAADAFRQLGIHTNNAEIRHGKLDQVLEIVANRFAAMPDGVKKTSTAMDLFGREGTTLIPLLNKGAAGIKELRAEAEKLGVVISKEGIEKAEEFEISQKKLHATLVGLRNQAVLALLPTLQKMADSISKWVQANQKVIQQRLHQFVELLSKGIVALGKGVVMLIDAMSWLSKHTTIATVAISAFVAVFAPWIAGAVAVYEALQAISSWFDQSNQETNEAKVAIRGFFKDVGNAAKATFEWIANLPIIKQLIWVIRQLTSGDIANGGAMSIAQNMLHEKQVGANYTGQGSDWQRYKTGEASVARDAGSAATGHTFNTKMDVHVNGGNPAEVEAAIKRGVADGQKDMLRQAHDAVKGGLK